ncbi:hypothetical protein FRB97_008338, partial [Tulasnella sp. 331]
TELLLIGEGKDVDEVLKDEGDAEQDMEQDARQDAKDVSPEEGLAELRWDEETLPCDALEGNWH